MAVAPEGGWRRERKKQHLYPTLAGIGSDADVVK
jgi:hypothetical protein